jgi:hypothetical protein
MESKSGGLGMANQPSHGGMLPAFREQPILLTPRKTGNRVQLEVVRAVQIVDDFDP